MPIGCSVDNNVPLMIVIITMMTVIMTMSLLIAINCNNGCGTIGVNDNDDNADNDNRDDRSKATGYHNSDLMIVIMTKMKVVMMSIVTQRVMMLTIMIALISVLI